MQGAQRQGHEMAVGLIRAPRPDNAAGSQCHDGAVTAHTCKAITATEMMQSVGAPSTRSKLCRLHRTAGKGAKLSSSCRILGTPTMPTLDLWPSTHLLCSPLNLQRSM
jgi:hypothetical protein